MTGRDPLGDFQRWEARARRRRLSQAAIAWALVIFAAIGIAAVVYFGIVTLIVVAS